MWCMLLHSITLMGEFLHETFAAGLTQTCLRQLRAKLAIPHLDIPWKFVVQRMMLNPDSLLRNGPCCVVFWVFKQLSCIDQSLWCFFLFDWIYHCHIHNSTITLQNHPYPSAVFVCFPCRDKIATGSFDKTCKLWSSETGKCYHTFRGHTAEIVSLVTDCPCLHT